MPMLANLANIISRPYSGLTNQVQKRLFLVHHYSSLFKIEVHKSTTKIIFQSTSISSYISFFNFLHKCQIYISLLTKESIGVKHLPAIDTWFALPFSCSTPPVVPLESTSTPH